MDEIRLKLQQALQSRPLDSIAMSELPRCYLKINKKKLDHAALGFTGLRQLLEAMPDVVTVMFDKKSSDYRVMLVNYEVSEEIIKEQEKRETATATTVTMVPESRSFNSRNSDGARIPVANRLREKPIPTAFRNQNDWELYLRNFSKDTQESDLMEIFKQFDCTRIRIKRREDDQAFGFATFKEYSDAETAYVTLDGTLFKGRRLNIQFARSSIASEQDVMQRLDKTQFTAQVTSTRRCFSSPEDRGFVDTKSVGSNVFNFTKASDSFVVTSGKSSSQKNDEFSFQSSRIGIYNLNSDIKLNTKQELEKQLKGVSDEVCNSDGFKFKRETEQFCTKVQASPQRHVTIPQTESAKTGSLQTNLPRDHPSSHSVEIQIWTRVYSRDQLRLADKKFVYKHKRKCRGLISSSESSSLMPVKVEEHLCEKCCDVMPQSMSSTVLQRMLEETKMKARHASAKDLPDKLHLMVVYVCNSTHFWGSVVNPGQLMDEYGDLFEMMNEISERAKPEYQLDKAPPGDKKAGIKFYQDWCRVWVTCRDPDGKHVEVFYIDYGNSEQRSVEDLFVLPRKCWDLRPMCLPFHLTEKLANVTLEELVNRKISARLVQPQPSNMGFVVAIEPEIEEVG